MSGTPHVPAPQWGDPEGLSELQKDMIVCLVGAGNGWYLLAGAEPVRTE